MQKVFLIGLGVLLLAGCGVRVVQNLSDGEPSPVAHPTKAKIAKSEGEWRKILTSTQYRVLREGDTERAFTGAFWEHHEAGKYLCVGCKTPLFASDTKFESGTGWPSFWKAVSKENVAERKDGSLGMERTEVTCRACGGHLGHVFDDGPAPTGLRYCINSASLAFQPNAQGKKSH